MRTKAPRNPKKNLYQIAVIVSVIAMVIYGYSLYISAKWHHTGKIYWNLTLCTLWFLSAILWLRKLGILAKEERENQ